MVATQDRVSPALKGFLTNMIRETMYEAGYTTADVLKHLAEKGPYIDSLSASEVTLALLEGLHEGAFHVEPATATVHG
jgi:hypothetical protein